MNLIRFAREATEQRRRAGVDAYRINDLTNHSELVKMIERNKDIDNYLEYPIQTQRQRILDAVDSASLRNARENLLQSPIFEMARQANLSALNLLEDLRKTYESPVEQLAKLAQKDIDSWTKARDLYSSQMPLNKFLVSQLSQITHMSALAQSALAGLDTSKIGGAFIIANEMKAIFTDKFTDFTTSYKDLFQSFETPETSLFKLSPSISHFPTLEFFNGVELLEKTIEEVQQEEDQDDYEEERLFVRNEIRASTNDSVIIQLQEVNENWIIMLEGARQAFMSTNPDKVRHCITSLRELLREIMQYLSPDEQIKNWSESDNDFHNNRPTRKARLRYITRNINHGKFTKFVEKDIESISAAIDIFQAGTHAANSKLTEAQVNALISKVEGAILFLFSIAKYEE